MHEVACIAELSNIILHESGLHPCSWSTSPLPYHKCKSLDKTGINTNSVPRPACDSHHSFICLQDTVVAIKQGGDNLTVSNMDEKKYPTATFSLDPKQVLHAPLHAPPHISMLTHKVITPCCLLAR